jgi:D-glycero-alpha-D-manno-heptose-7-phosphate kinase
LGSSGALDVALVAATDRMRKVSRMPFELAEEAFELESVEARLPGGRQDQYAAALGGFHKFEFSAAAVRIEPLQLDPAFLTELAAHLVVCYTGISRVSSRAIERVVAAYRERNPPVVAALRSLVGIAEAMAGAFSAGNLSEVGRLLDANWAEQRRLDPSMSTPDMERLEAAMRQAGSLGGKAAGAGAGGSMFFVVPDATRARLAAEALGARVLAVQWAFDGVRVEEAA